MIEGDFDGLVGAKAIGFFDRQFRFVVETLDGPGGNGPFCPEPIGEEKANAEIGPGL